MVFSLEEKTDMLKIYYKSNERCELASYNYEQTFPERWQLDRTYFLKLHRIFQEWGSLMPKKRNRRERNLAFKQE